MSDDAARRDVFRGVVGTLALVFALSWAERFVVPVLLGIVIAYTLNPLVVALQRLHLPRAVSTLLVMASVIGAFGFGTYALRGEVEAIVDELPNAMRKVTAAIQQARLGQLGSMARLQTAATEVEKATAQVAATPPVAARQPATHVVVDAPTFRLGSLLWEGSLGAVVVAGQAATVLFLVFFLLIGGDRFRRKLVQLTGPTLSHKKITVQILDAINASIQKYMLMLLVTNLLVALASWVAFRWIGLENAGAWALAAGLLHVVPYLGPSVTALAAGMAAYLQFESVAQALLVAGVSLGIATIIGTFVATWMIGRIANMNSVAIFVALLFWGWLWGIWGLLLAIPIVVIVKVVAEHVESLQPVAELLGD